MIRFMSDRHKLLPTNWISSLKTGARCTASYYVLNVLALCGKEIKERDYPYKH